MTGNPLNNKSILLVISGGIAAYKALELIRLIRKAGAQVRVILTQGGEKFVTPLSAAALSESPVYTDLWSLKDETEMGHIRLGREADLVVVAPASANFLSGAAHGRADDLAHAVLLACAKPVLMAPAMNPEMWSHPAVQENVQTLRSRGVRFVGPAEGETACGETGLGRMAEPEEILGAISRCFSSGPLKGRKILVTSGPTYEPIDPVRFLGNRSSGRQGHAIAQALADLGADVLLVSGPVSIPDPSSPNVRTVRVETAQEMLATVRSALPVDIAVFAAAVSDWRVRDPASSKRKKTKDSSPPALDLEETPDILAEISGLKQDRPGLVIGFAAETENIRENAEEKLLRKGCDWILANGVTQDGETVFGHSGNRICFLSKEPDGCVRSEDWPSLSKKDVGRKLAEKISVSL